MVERIPVTLGVDLSGGRSLRFNRARYQTATDEVRARITLNARTDTAHARAMLAMRNVDVDLGPLET